MKYTEYMEHIRNALTAESEEMFIAENGFSADCPYSPDNWLAIQHTIWSAATGNIKSLISNQSKFARDNAIPLRTVQSWYAGINKCPSYVIMLLGFAKVSEVEQEC